MRRALLLIAAFYVPLAAQSAAARDLWGESEIILSEEATPVLMRTQRMRPGMRLLPMIADEAENAPELPNIEAASVGPTTVDATDYVGAVVPEVVTPTTSTQLPGRVLTAPPIPGRAAPALSADTYVADVVPGEPDHLQTDETGIAELANPTDPNAPDISGVEIFGESPDETGDSGEVEVARVYDPDITLLPDAELEGPEEPLGPPPQVNSLAYSGIFSGVGIAEGMRLRLELADSNLDGWFLDSSGQNFRVDGQLTNMDGRAQAVVISASIPVGYFDLQLTNLGMTALFVPLSEDMTPITGDARQYEFLRTLSDAALSALEAERAAREASSEPLGQTSRPREIQTGPLQESFPGDEDSAE